MDTLPGLVSQNQSVLDVWLHHATHHPEREAIVHWDALGDPCRWTYRALLDEALYLAGHLIRHNIKPGDVCALILRHNKYFYPVYMAIAAIGAIPAVLAYPNPRLHPDKFIHGLSGMAHKSGLDWILTEKDLEPVISPLIRNEPNTIKGILFPLEWASAAHQAPTDRGADKGKLHAVTGAHPFLLQHSSGTTGLQKAVIMSSSALLDHIDSYSKAIGLSSGDKIINWLPLYHDMGLIAAFHMPLICGIPSIQLDPFQWVCAPSIFFKAIAKEKATLAWLPNFSYNFMADRVAEDEMVDIDLSTMRLFVNCSEVVRQESHDKFFTRYSKYGVKRESLSTCYAMAETIFAATQTEPGLQAKHIAIDRDALAKGIVLPPRKEGPAKVCVSSGKPIDRCTVKIIDDVGNALPEDRVGTIVIKSDSLFDGYRNDPEKTRQVLKERWYTSGDLGFFHEGDCYVIGRRDDVIIAAGRNIFPEDIEDALSKVPGVLPGRVIAFGADDEETGTEDVCVIAETSHEIEKDKNALTISIKQAGMAIDITIAKVYLVPPRWMIKSSSGKPSRKTNKERILSETGIRG